MFRNKINKTKPITKCKFLENNSLVFNTMHPLSQDGGERLITEMVRHMWFLSKHHNGNKKVTLTARTHDGALNKLLK